MKRVIYVEPVIDNSKVIFDIFKKYNPDSSFVNPHICLVFPFESDLDISTLENIIMDTFNKYNNFDIQLSGLSVSYEEKNNFLFLNVIDESNILKQMSKSLYKNLGEYAKLKGEYIPHITIGKSNSIDEINYMYNTSKELLKNNYKASISSVYCKKIIKDFNGNTKLEDEVEVELYHSVNKIF